MSTPSAAQAAGESYEQKIARLERELAAQKEQYRVLTDEMLVIHTRYETVRRMRPAQFAELFRANIEQNIPFDDLVDNAATAQGRKGGGRQPRRLPTRFVR